MLSGSSVEPPAVKQSLPLIAAIGVLLALLITILQIVKD
jgi:hypothetical protein